MGMPNYHTDMPGYQECPIILLTYLNIMNAQLSDIPGYQECPIILLTCLDIPLVCQRVFCVTRLYATFGRLSYWHAKISQAHTTYCSPVSEADKVQR